MNELETNHTKENKEDAMRLNFRLYSKVSGYGDSGCCLMKDSPAAMASQRGSTVPQGSQGIGCASPKAALTSLVPQCFPVIKRG